MPTSCLAKWIKNNQKLIVRLRHILCMSVFSKKEPCKPSFLTFMYLYSTFYAYTTYIKPSKSTHFVNGWIAHLQSFDLRYEQSCTSSLFSWATITHDHLLNKWATITHIRELLFCKNMSYIHSRSLTITHDHSRSLTITGDRLRNHLMPNVLSKCNHNKNIYL